MTTLASTLARFSPLPRLTAAWSRRQEQRERERSRQVPIREWAAVGQPTRVAGIDLPLIAIACCLLALSLVMVYSASIALPDSRKFASYAPTHFLLRQAVAIGIGVILAAIALRIPMPLWERAAPWLFAIALVLLALVLLPMVGKGANGARRWMPLGPISFQPSELAKLAMALYAASYMLRKMDVKERFVKAMWPMAVALAVVGLLLLAEPDMGAFLVIACIALGILFLGGVNGRAFALSVLVLLAAFALMIALSPWRRERLFAFLDPWDPVYAQGKGYQLTHSLIAFGRGELTGQGLGESLEKLHYLPEAHTDFLLAVIGEELGFIGVCAVICAFFFLTRRIFAIGRQAVALDRVFAGLAAQGIGIWLGVQALINIGVNLGALPTKGLTLPLLSYGGSAVMLTLLALGVVLRVDLENRQLMRGGRA